MPRPARRIAITTISSASRIPPVVSSGVSIASSRTRRSRSASNSSSIEMSESRRRKSLDGVARSRSTERWRATSGWSTTVTPVMGAGRYLSGGRVGAARMAEIGSGGWSPPATSSSRRTTPIPPARSSARSPRAREDRGLLRQRDTYFAVAARPAQAARGGARRRDADRLRASRRRRPSACRATGSSPVAGPRARCATRSPPSTGVPRRRRQAPPPAAVGDRADPPRRGPRPRLVPRARGGRRARLRPEPRARAGRAAARGARDPRRRAARGLLRRRADRGGRRCGEPDAELLALAREAAGRAYAPYSNFPVGAALRTTDGRRYAGANVENAAYPQGQCAEASAIGALVAGGGGRIAEVVVAAPSRELCTPCGGCRQRLREFARRRRADPPRRPRARAPHDDARASCCRSPSARSTSPHDAPPPTSSPSARPASRRGSGLMLGSGLGELADRLDDRVEIPYGELPGFHVGGLAGHAGALVLGRLAGPARRDLLRPLARLRGDRRRARSRRRSAR